MGFWSPHLSRNREDKQNRITSLIQFYAIVILPYPEFIPVINVGDFLWHLVGPISTHPRFDQFSPSIPYLPSGCPCSSLHILRPWAVHSCATDSDRSEGHPGIATPQDMPKSKLVLFERWDVIFILVLGLYNVIYPIGSMYAIYGNIWGILMVNVTIYGIHGSYGYYNNNESFWKWNMP